MRRSLILAMAGAVLAFPVVAVLAAQPPELEALSGLEQGEWELKEHGGASAPRRLCIGDAAQLLQPHHPGRQCKRFVLENSAQRVAVTYDCARAGQGRTALRVETARLVQIDSQGVSGGAPFAMTIEGRRVGACRATALAR